MDWSKGYSARFLAFEVDPITWRDMQPVDIIDGAITKETGSLRQSATVDTKAFDGSTEKWIRIYMEARQAGDSYYGAMFTGLASTPKLKYDGTNLSIPIQCYSVLKPLEDIYLPKGWFVSANADALAIIQELLSVTPAPIEPDGNPPRLASSIVAEEQETNLSMVENILKSIDWQLDIDGDGRIRLHPTVHEVDPDVVVFSALSNDCLETSVDIEYDWFACPNVCRVTYGDAIAIARDDDPNSRLSTVNRGREIWKEERDITLGDHETLDMYVERMLKDEQKVAYKVSYRRRYHPDVTIGSIIGMNYPRQNLNGYFRVESQSITLGYNATVSEQIVGI